MGRTARRPGPPSFLFGVWGQGETSQENVDALLSEFIEGLGEVTPRFLIPLDKDITTATHLAVVTFAEENKFAIEVVQAAPPRTKALREVKEIADKVHEAEGDDIEGAFIDALAAKAPDNSRMLFLWAEDEKTEEPLEDDQRVLFKGFDADVIALDLTQGLDVLGSDAEDGGEGGGDDAADDTGDGTDGEPPEAEVREWPIRRLRKYVLEVAAAEREADGVDPNDVPTDEQFGDMKGPGASRLALPAGERRRLQVRGDRARQGQRQGHHPGPRPADARGGREGRHRLLLPPEGRRQEDRREQAQQRRGGPRSWCRG